jgi:hypothetical protein
VAMKTIPSKPKSHDIESTSTVEAQSIPPTSLLPVRPKSVKWYVEGMPTDFHIIREDGSERWIDYTYEVGQLPEEDLEDMLRVENTEKNA